MNYRISGTVPKERLPFTVEMTVEDSSTLKYAFSSLCKQYDIFKYVHHIYCNSSRKRPCCLDSPNLMFYIQVHGRFHTSSLQYTFGQVGETVFKYL